MDCATAIFSLCIPRLRERRAIERQIRVELRKKYGDNISEAQFFDRSDIEHKVSKDMRDEFYRAKLIKKYRKDSDSLTINELNELKRLDPNRFPDDKADSGTEFSINENKDLITNGIKSKPFKTEQKKLGPNQPTPKPRRGEKNDQQVPISIKSKSPGTNNHPLLQNKSRAIKNKAPCLPDINNNQTLGQKPPTVKDKINWFNQILDINVDSLPELSDQTTKSRLGFLKITDSNNDDRVTHPHFVRGWNLLIDNTNNADKALELFNGVLYKYGDDIDSLIGCGFAYYLKKDYETAISYYETFIAPLKQDGDTQFTKPFLSSVYRLIGKTYLHINIYEKSIEYSNISLDYEVNCDNLMVRANTNYCLKEYMKAVVDCDKAIQVDSRFFEAKLLKLYCLNNLNLLDECIQLSNEIFKHSVNEKTKLNILKCRIKALDKKYSMNPEMIEVLEQGIRACNAYTELDPNCIQALQIKGKFFKCLAKFDEAMNCFNKIISLGTPVYELRGDVYYLQKKYDLAICDYDKQMEIDSAKKPDTSTYSVHESKAIVMFVIKKFEESIQCYETALKKLNSNDNLVESRLLVGKADGLFQLERFEESLKYCERAIIMCKKNTRAHSIKGRCLFMKSQYRNALSHFCPDSNPTDDSINNYFKGKCHMELNEYDKAVDSFEKCLEVCRSGDSLVCPGDVLYEKATCHFNLRTYESCIAALDEALKIGTREYTSKEMLKLKKTSLKKMAESI